MRHGGGGVGQTPDFRDNSCFDGTYFHNSAPEPVKGYCTDVWFDYARRFIKAQKKASKPFLGYISTNAAHWPMHAPPEFAAPYEEQFGAHVGHFLGMIANIDHNVGRLRAFLEEESLAKNTIFIFTSDNGTGAAKRSSTPACGAGSKASMTEGIDCRWSSIGPPTGLPAGATSSRSPPTSTCSPL